MRTRRVVDPREQTSSTDTQTCCLAAIQLGKSTAAGKHRGQSLPMQKLLYCTEGKSPVVACHVLLPSGKLTAHISRHLRTPSSVSAFNSVNVSWHTADSRDHSSRKATLRQCNRCTAMLVLPAKGSVRTEWCAHRAKKAVGAAA